MTDQYDEKLKKELFEIAVKLTSNKRMENIGIHIVDEALFMGNTEVMQRKSTYLHRILFNRKAWRYLKTEGGREHVYATMAHEIGHCIHHERVVKDATGQIKTAKFFLDSEVGADLEAVFMLSGIFKNPAAMIRRQATRALKTSIRNKHAWPEDKEIARIIFKTRIKSLDTFSISSEKVAFIA